MRKIFKNSFIILSNHSGIQTMPIIYFAAPSSNNVNLFSRLRDLPRYTPHYNTYGEAELLFRRRPDQDWLVISLLNTLSAFQDAIEANKAEMHQDIFLKHIQNPVYYYLHAQSSPFILTVPHNGMLDMTPARRTSQQTVASTTPALNANRFPFHAVTPPIIAADKLTHDDSGNLLLDCPPGITEWPQELSTLEPASPDSLFVCVPVKGKCQIYTADDFDNIVKNPSAIIQDVAAGKTFFKDPNTNVKVDITQLFTCKGDRLTLLGGLEAPEPERTAAQQPG